MKNTTNDKGRPEPGKVYSLTGGPDTPSIARGDSWAASEVRPAPVAWPENPVARYCARYAAQCASAAPLSPDAFAKRMLAHFHGLCAKVLDDIGSWPSSEPELAALQRCFR